ncbi:GNAT family N-acetyltransferase [Salinirubellus salinus]|uniref:GNAT family N-acetyltransferase n=1 Tax=Salinirubellus salinus TaxID=1364945 RepID=A0A9E7R7H1_9EURY|nr:GNAT family N-acetyltransferase [Salinirubellus salinus]UWM56048.1 GNAT family N-acetyltransferase [Salinirubellus salinus]
MNVRSARPEDAARVATVSRTSCEAVYEGMLADEALLEAVRDPAFPAELRTWLERLPLPGVAYLLAERDDEVVGFAQYLWSPANTEPFVGEDEALLHSLYAHPDHWGTGVGTVLVDAGRERLPDDRRTLRLGVLKPNEVGVGFYESYGFERTGEAVVETMGGAYDCWVYSLGLD